MTIADFYGKTDIGNKRKNNEDNFYISPELGFCVVADGMGGAASGEIASGIFIQTAIDIFSNNKRSPQKTRLPNWLERAKLFLFPEKIISDPIHDELEFYAVSVFNERSKEQSDNLISDVFQMSNQRILNYIKKHPRSYGMGCTADLIAFSENEIVVGHIGDSRIYAKNKDQLIPITKDHSIVQEQLDQGVITADEARYHPQKNVITKAVGVDKDITPDLITIASEPGAMLLLCSDGLTDFVDESLILEILNENHPLSQKTRNLIQEAKTESGKDNITVVLVEMK